MSRRVVFLTIGPPGAGKTYFVSWNLVGSGIISPIDVLCPDGFLFQDGEYCWTEKAVRLAWLKTQKEFLQLLNTNRPFVIDATLVTKESRARYIRTAKDKGYKVIALFFDVPFEVLVTRNKTRMPSSKRLDIEIIKKFYNKLEPPKKEEGFYKIFVIDLKGNIDKSFELEKLKKEISILSSSST
jgi:predicted kinase